jgi:hypothetical protein
MRSRISGGRGHDIVYGRAVRRWLRRRDGICSRIGVGLLHLFSSDTILATFLPGTLQPSYTVLMRVIVMITFAFPSWVSPPHSCCSRLFKGLPGSPILGLVDSYHCCTVVNGRKGCGRNKKTRTSGSGCVTSGYVSCPGETFCRRAYSYPHSLSTRRSVHSRSCDFPSSL